MVLTLAKITTNINQTNTRQDQTTSEQIVQQKAIIK